MTVTVVVPSRNERFLGKTCQDALEKAAGDVEVIAICDGGWLHEEDFVVPGVTYLHRGSPQGMRAGINAGAALARGEFLMKVDGHCMFSEGYDVELAESCGAQNVVVPRRKRLDPINWCVKEVHKPDIDYMFLSFPDDPNDWGGKGLNGKVWEERNRDTALKAVEIDDLMSAQGSGWFMHRSYFDELELMDEGSYGTFWNEFQEIGLKCWLSGGRVIVNKRAWYAHLHKGKEFGRGYRLLESSLTTGARYTIKWMTEPVGGAWHKATVPLFDLIERFWPVPTWPALPDGSPDRERWEAAAAEIRASTA